MQKSIGISGKIAAGFALLVLSGFGQPPGLKLKAENKAKELAQWQSNAEVVAAVKVHNASPSSEAKAMTNERWRNLTVLDPFVRGFSKNAAALSLKAKKDDAVSECFVSAADGAKVAFLSKPTFWSHADKDKHRVPMAGKIWVGPVETDESTGVQQIQVGMPVMDGGKPIGSIVFGLFVEKLR